MPATLRMYLCVAGIGNPHCGMFGVAYALDARRAYGSGATGPVQSATLH
ncbi:hypothetical protein [Xanthomonas sp. MUS 060]|nr:hypothetical protein [Xanthomonas sp. MUS 060]